MKPRIAASLGLALILSLASAGTAIAQGTPAPEGPGGLPSEAEVTGSSDNPFLPGEQTVALAAGVQLPVFILPDTRAIDEAKLKTGGSFSFSYQYFISPGLALGGTVGGSFNATIGGRSLFVAPLTFKAAYWWSLLPFEFELGVEAGGYILRLGSYGMIGPVAKAGGGVFWRAASSWSVGLQSELWVVPEIHVGDYADLTRTGGFVEVSAIAVYHL